MSNYIPINKDNLPEVGDIIATDGGLMSPDDFYYIEDFNAKFEINFLYEILGVNEIDEKDGYPNFHTIDLKYNNNIVSGIIDKHKIIDSYFNDWYIIVDRSKRNKIIKGLLNED